MKIGRTWDQQDERDILRRDLERRPHRWFAWRPVTLDDGRTVWLEPVRRCRTSVLDRWHYEEVR